MRKPSPLTRAYLEARPHEAARVLEHVAPDSCAALLNTLPLKLTTEVLRHMAPYYAARCLEQLQTAAAVGLLRALEAQTAADVLRYLPPAHRDSLLAELPAALALTLKVLLTYPEDTVGAWIDTRVPTLPLDATAKEALDRVRRSTDDALELVFVVGNDRRLAGVVRLSSIVRAQSRAPLAQLMHTGVPVIPAQAPLSAAGRQTAWTEFRSLGVVDTDDRFVGALHYDALVRAYASRPQQPMTKTAVDMLLSIGGAYWLGISTVIGAVLPALTRVARGFPNGR